MSRQVKVLAVGLQVATLCVLGRPAEAQHAVIDWSRIAQQAITVGRPPASSEYLLALVHAAMCDAAVAVEGRYRSFGVGVNGGEGASTAAAVAAAAYHVLITRLPDGPSLAPMYDAYVAAIDHPGRDHGLAIGMSVAGAWLQRRSGDRFDEVAPYVQPLPGPGVFEPVAPATPVDVKMAHVEPYVMPSGDWFRPAGPPPLTSRSYAKSFWETLGLGRFDPSGPPLPHHETARFWAENTAVQWNRNLHNLAARAGLDHVNTARIALVHVSSADALVACFDAKYHFMAWRPIHAIHRAHTDGNRWTVPDPSWTPLLTVNHPEYPAAHSCWSTAVTESLAFLFGHGRVDVAIDSTQTGTTRTYRRFADISKEIDNARIFAGLHFRFSTDDGADIGRNVARLVARRHFQPVWPRH